MASPLKRRGPLSSWLGGFITVGILVVWWVTLAPTLIGGPATFVLVEGHSMEPMFHIGDLAVTRREPTYNVGDVIVMKVQQGPRNGLIIHRLNSGSANTEWRTKGDNNPVPDAFTITNAQIQGKYLFSVPGFGGALKWVSDNFLGFGAVCAALGLALYAPWRRRKLAPALAQALDTGQREPRREGRTRQEYFVLCVSAAGAFVSLALVGLMAIRHELVSIGGMVGLIALAWAGGFTVYSLYRLYDGSGVPEPSRSMYALSGRLYLVSEFPALDCEVQEVKSAVALRTIAEKYRMPVLHSIDPETGQHEFLLITVQQGCFRWAPQQALATSPSGGDSFGGTRPPSGPRGRHSGLTPNPGPGAAVQAHPVSIPVVGRALSALGAGAVLGHESVWPFAIASVAGPAVGLTPDGRHAARVPRSLRSRVRWIATWVLVASLVTAAAMHADWISANKHLVMVAGGALAAVVAGATSPRRCGGGEAAPGLTTARTATGSGPP